MAKSHHSNKYGRVATKINGLAKIIENHFYTNKDRKRTRKHPDLTRFEKNNDKPRNWLINHGRGLKNWLVIFDKLLNDKSTTIDQMEAHHKNGMRLIRLTPEIKRQKSTRRLTATEQTDRDRIEQNTVDMRKTDTTKRTMDVLIQAMKKDWYPVWATFTFNDYLLHEDEWGIYKINIQGLKAIHKLCIEAEHERARIYGFEPRTEKELKPLYQHKPEWGSKTNRLHYHDIWILKTLPLQFESDPNGHITLPKDYSITNGWKSLNHKLWDHGHMTIMPVRMGINDIWAQKHGFRYPADLPHNNPLDIIECAVTMAKYMGKEAGKSKQDYDLKQINSRSEGPMIKSHSSPAYGTETLDKVMSEMTDKELAILCDLPTTKIFTLWYNYQLEEPTTPTFCRIAAKHHKYRVGDLTDERISRLSTSTKILDQYRNIRKKEPDLVFEKRIKRDQLITGPIIYEIIRKTIKHTCAEALDDLDPGITRNLLYTHARISPALHACYTTIRNSNHALWKIPGHDHEQAENIHKEMLNALECALAYAEAPHTGLHRPDERHRKSNGIKFKSFRDISTAIKETAMAITSTRRDDEERQAVLDDLSDKLQDQIRRLTTGL